MEKNGPGRRRSDGKNKRSSYRNLMGTNMEMASEFVPVPADLKGRVIGKKGNVINAIRAESGARITSDRDDLGFTVSGTEEQRACAIRLINQKKENAQKRNRSEDGHLISIPSKYMGLVIGKGGDTLRNISTQTGAHLFVQDGRARGVCVRGSEAAVEQAGLQIRYIVAGARLRGLKHEFNKVSCFIDDWNLPDECELSLREVKEKESMVLPGSQLQCRVKAVEEYELTQQADRGATSSYLAELRQNALDCLHNIKREMESNGNLRADMWCHFGIAVIREPDAADVDETWSTTEVAGKVNGSDWKIAFKEGVELDESSMENRFGEQAPEKYMARYDLTFLTPSCYSVRCKVWVAKPGLTEKLEDIPIPCSDVKNIVEEINFEDDATSSRCRGWLVLPSKKYLQADIIFPGCEFDIRMTIRTGTTDAPEEEETRILTNYLSKLTFTDDEDYGIHLPQEKLAEGFHYIHRRCSHRAVYTPREGFAVMVSKENTWSTDGIKEETRKTTDLHLHVDEWNQAFNGEDWEPEVILDKLPDFLEFVKKVQELICDCMKKNE